MARLSLLFGLLLSLLTTLTTAQDSHNPIFFVNPLTASDASSVKPADYPLYKWGSTIDIKWSASLTLGLSLVIFQDLPNQPTDYVYLFQNKSGLSDFKWTVATDRNLSATPTFFFEMFIEGETSPSAESQFFNISQADSATTTTATSTTAAVTTTKSAPTTTSTTALPSPSSSGLSSGAKAGIGVGVALGAVVVLGLGWFFWRQRRRGAGRGAGAAQQTPEAAPAYSDHPMGEYDQQPKPVGLYEAEGEGRHVPYEAAGDSTFPAQSPPVVKQQPHSPYHNEPVELPPNSPR